MFRDSLPNPQEYKRPEPKFEENGRMIGLTPLGYARSLKKNATLDTYQGSHHINLTSMM